MSPEERERASRKPAGKGPRRFAARKQRRTIDREPLKLDTLPARLESTFSEGRRGRSKEDLGMARTGRGSPWTIVAGKLEGLKRSRKSSRSRKSQGSSPLPACFAAAKEPADGRHESGEHDGSCGTPWLLPMIKEHSPALYALLTRHYKEFTKALLPLSKTQETDRTGVIASSSLLRRSRRLKRNQT